MRVIQQGFACLLIAIFSATALAEVSQQSAAYQVLTMDQLQVTAPKFFDRLQNQLIVSDDNDFQPVRFGDTGEVAALTNSLIVQIGADGDAGNLEYAFDVDVEPMSGLDDTYVLRFNSVETAMSAYAIALGMGDVTHVQNDYQLNLISRSNDAQPKDVFFKDQWHLKNTGQLGEDHNVDIQILEAWKTTTGAKTKPIIAVIDGGFDMGHPDLVDNWFANEDEIPDNDIDDDENGLVDDYIGWNFALDTNKLNFGFGSDHGTAVAGLVGAGQNELGTVGTCPDCRILPLAVNGRTSRDAKAFLYAIERGASIITNSWGYSIGSRRTKVVEEAIAKAAKEGRGDKGAIIFFAMNNSHVDDCTGRRPDISSHPDVIAVSSMDGTGTRVKKSGYGACLKFLSMSGQSSKIDGVVTTDSLGAAGYNYSKDNDNELSDWNYTKHFGGTSAATPVLAGGVALLMDLNPDITKADLIKILASTARKVEPEKAKYDKDTGHSESHGFGLVSIDAAVAALLKRQ